MFGRKDIKNLRLRVSRAIPLKLVAIGHSIARIRPARWIASKRAARVAVALCILAYVGFGRYVWRPGMGLIRRARRYLGRHQVWAHLITWGICGLGGFLLAATWRNINPDLIKILAAFIVAAAFTVICFRSPFTGLMVYLFILPLSKTIMYVKLAKGLPLLTIDTALVPIILLAYVIQPKKASETEQTRSVHWFMALFMIGMIWAGLRSEIPRNSIQTAITQYGIPIFMYLFARRWITSRRQLAILFLMILIIAVYHVGFAVPEHFTGRNLLTRPGMGSYIERELGTVRAQGASQSPAEFGLTLTLALCVVLVRMSEAPKGRKVLFAVLAVAFIAGMAYTLRRSVYAGAILALLIMLVSTARPRRLVALTIACCVLAIAVSWHSLINSELYKVRLGAMKPVYQRAVMHATAWNIVKHYPWFGMGFNSYAEGNRRYLVGYGDIMPWYGAGFRAAHSSYWRIMVEGGMFAFVPFCLTFLMMLLATLRIYRRVREPGLVGRDGVVVFWAYAMGVLLQAGTTSSFYYDRYLIVLMYMYYGALVGTHLRVRNLAEEPVPTAGRTLTVPAPSRAIGG